MSHELLKGVLVGLSSLGFILFAFNRVAGLPYYLIALAPFIAGLVAGKAGRGAKAGMLTALIPIVVIGVIILGTVASYQNQATPMPTVNANGNPFGAIAQGLLATGYGFASAMSGLGTILLMLFMVIFAIGSVIALAVSAILGAIGGAIGKAIFRDKGEPKQEKNDESRIKKMVKMNAKRSFWHTIFWGRPS